MERSIRQETETPANNYDSEPSCKWVWPGLLMVTAQSNILTATSWDTLNQNHPINPFLNSWPTDIMKWSEVKSRSHVRLFAGPWTVACQAPPSMGFSRQEYWSGLPFPSPGDLPDPGIEAGSPASQADALPSKPPAAAAAKSLQSCLTVRPHRRQPTRLPRPWDSPGKNTGVGRHFLLQCMKVKSESEVAQSCLTLATLWTAAYQAPPSMGFSRQEYWSGVPLPSPLSHLSDVKNLKLNQHTFKNLKLNQHTFPE